MGYFNLSNCITRVAELVSYTHRVWKAEMQVSFGQLIIFSRTLACLLILHPWDSWQVSRALSQMSGFHIFVCMGPCGLGSSSNVAIRIATASGAVNMYYF